MTLDLLFEAPFEIRMHLAAAAAAILLGPLALYRRRRDRWHRLAGRTWVAAMSGVALTGLAIPAGPIAVVGPFGPIHVLSGLVLWWLWQGVAEIRAGRVAVHREIMRSLYWNALGIAALFTLIPGRRVSAAFFGDRTELALAAMAAVSGALVLRWARLARAERRAV